MSNHDGPPPGSVPVPPSPVPVSWQFGKATSDMGQAFLVVQIATPVGMSILFLDRDTATAFFTQGSASAATLTGGIILPNMIPPGDLR